MRDVTGLSPSTVILEKTLEGHYAQAKKSADDDTSTLALKPMGRVIRSPKQGEQWPHNRQAYCGVASQVHVYLLDKCHHNNSMSLLSLFHNKTAEH